MDSEKWVDISTDGGENTARVTRKAFEQTWKEKGWEIVEPKADEAPSAPAYAPRTTPNTGEES